MEEQNRNVNSLEETTEAVETDQEQTSNADNAEDPNDDAEFVWDEYLEETNSIAAPPTLFRHVETSLKSCFKAGMKLEVPNRESNDTYWVASVVITCGPLLRLRYDGYDEDRSADFWCDLATNEVHPVGWCMKNGKELSPPSAILNKYSDWHELLKRTLDGAITIPEHVLKANGTTPIDIIKQGMKIEVKEKLNPLRAWIATVLENVGGRLLLRYDGANPSDDFWLFYLSYRLQPVGWIPESRRRYFPPEAIVSQHTTEEWLELLKQALDEAKKFPLLEDIFKSQENIQQHGFNENMKLEAVNPTTCVQFCPATVTKVLSPEFFCVQIDDYSMADKQPQVMCCHADSGLIFPPGWAESNELTIMNSKGWVSRQDFDWTEYLNYFKAEAAPDNLFNLPEVEHGFEKGMKLEAVNPFQPHQICAATITKVVGHLLWIQLDSIDTFHPNHIVPYNSHDIFPVGWCESNRYPLKPPLHIQRGKGRVVMKIPIYLQDKQKKTEKSEGTSDAKAWCPKIYFNHRCFTGPYLSNGRIAQLPRHVGPGPVVLVLKEVLSKLINVAYKSSKVLQELELKGKHNPTMQQCVLKAKYKGKCYRRVVEVLRNSEHVKDFCRDICLKLDCCPYLFGPKHVGDNCPDQCSNLTKTKYASKTYTRRKRRLGRPPLASKKTETNNSNSNTNSNANSSSSPKKRGRKRKNLDSVEQEGEDEDKLSDVVTSTSNNDNECGDGMEASESDENAKQKRKYVRQVPSQKSDIVTRGNKPLTQNDQKRTSSLDYASVPSSPGTKASSDDFSKEPSETSQSDVIDEKPLPTDLIPFPSVLRLEKNPLYWSVEEVIQFMKETDCAHMVRMLRDQDIDGQALLLLTLPTVQEHLELKLGPAIKLCHHVERIKLAYFSQFAK